MHRRERERERGRKSAPSHVAHRFPCWKKFAGRTGSKVLLFHELCEEWGGRKTRKHGQRKEQQAVGEQFQRQMTTQLLVHTLATTSSSMPARIRHCLITSVKSSSNSGGNRLTAWRLSSSMSSGPDGGGRMIGGFGATGTGESPRMTAGPPAPMPSLRDSRLLRDTDLRLPPTDSSTTVIPSGRGENTGLEESTESKLPLLPDRVTPTGREKDSSDVDTLRNHTPTK